jgi:HSP20 family protein
MSNLIPSGWKDSVEQLRNGVLDVFDRWLPQRHRREGERNEFLWPGTFLAQGGPAVDVIEDDAAVRVTAELPGLDEKDFHIEVRNDRLILRGEKKSSREEKKRDCFFSECSYGSFSRSIALPCEVDADKATANYKNGVLNITLPKVEGAQPKRIKVNIS